MDVKTGEVLAMVSYPWFDPSLFNPDAPIVDRVEQIIALENDPATPLVNRPMMGLYAAGSIFKIVSMAAGLDSGVYNENTAISCGGTWYGGQYGDALAERYDWYRQGHGYVDFPHALTWSCDPYFWQLGVNLYNADPPLLTNYAYEMGLGVSTGQTELPEEIGQIPNDELVFRLNGRGWHIADSINLVIGQGETLITPMQITRTVAAVANGGTLYKPQFVDKVQLLDETPVYEAKPDATKVLDYDPHTFELIRDAMCDVTLDPTGTARYIYGPWYDFQETDVVVCGKTGTAQTGGTGVKPQAWFAAFAPQDDPQIAVVVIVENSCEGSEVASPIVARIVEDYYGMPHFDYPAFWQSGCFDLGE
jgi:penicillin-binding protein 2